MDTQDDYEDDDDLDTRARDLKCRCAVNKGYLNNKVLKKDKDGQYFDLRQKIIKNTERYYDRLFSDNDLVSISNSINCFSDNLFKVFVSILYANGLDKNFL